jgi:hypothetical protein
MSDMACVGLPCRCAKSDLVRRTTDCGSIAGWTRRSRSRWVHDVSGECRALATFGAFDGSARGNRNLVEAIGDSVHVPDQITLEKPLYRFLDRMLIALDDVFPLGSTCGKLDHTRGTGGRWLNG